MSVWTTIQEKMNVLNGKIPETLGNLDDVSALDPDVGDRLVWNGTAWESAPTASNTDASALSTGTLGVDRLPLAGVIVVDKAKSFYGAAGSWPAARPTTRTDIVVFWLGDTDPGSVAIAGDIVDLVG